jgi:hypothetical protein
MVFDQAIKSIDWAGRESNLSPARFKLLNEYFRRAAYWSHALNAPHLFPFGDFPSALAGESAVTGIGTDAAESLEGLKMSTRERILVEYMAAWEQLPSEKKAAYDLPDLYAPLLMYFRRGGSVHVENRMLSFQGAMIPIRPMEAYLAMEELPLDETYLDRLDLSA